MKSVTNDVLEEDLPPEFVHYRDEGCEHAARCLNCPFKKCLYEEPGGREHYFKSRRNSEVARRRGEGKSTREIAKEFNVSERTVQRIIRSFTGTKAG